MSLSAADRHLADGLFESASKKWPSAAESFERCVSLSPRDYGPVLAAAICRLQLGQGRAAVLLLETSPCTGTPPSPPFDLRHAWLTCAARLAVGDPHGAVMAATALDGPLRQRVIAHASFASGDLRGGVKALLSAFSRAGSERAGR